MTHTWRPPHASCQALLYYNRYMVITFLISQYDCLLSSGPHPGMHRQQAGRLCSNIRFTKRCARQMLRWRYLKKEEATSKAGERKEENEGNGQGQRPSRGFHGSHSDQRLVHRTTYAVKSRMSHPLPPLVMDLCDLRCCSALSYHRVHLIQQKCPQMSIFIISRFSRYTYIFSNL